MGERDPPAHGARVRAAPAEGACVQALSRGGDSLLPATGVDPYDSVLDVVNMSDEEACEEGSIDVSFRSIRVPLRLGSRQGARFVGRREHPGAGIYYLPGTGRYRCEGYSAGD